MPNILARMESPRLIVLGDFLSHAECDHLIGLGAPHLQDSKTLNGAQEVSNLEWRKSSNCFLRRWQTETVRVIEKRIADYFLWPLDHFEPFQIVRYVPGQEYKPHHDYFKAGPNVESILANGGQRVGTLIIYLSDVLTGGETKFHDVGLSVTPQKGNAVFFWYDQPEESSKTLHSGEPVISGEKWIATKWFRASAWCG